MKYIDAEKLIAEIERQQRRLIILSHTEQVDMRRDCALQNGVYDNILSIIASLQQEQAEVDLEKEMDSYFNEHFSPCVDGTLISERTGMEIDGNDYDDIARHFYELGLNARKED